jgi:enoyl-CoA hydratase/carnithine racemase
MEFERLEVTVKNRVGWLAYAHPPVNAFDWLMVEEVIAALDRLLGDEEVRVIVFASALEKYFSAGADIREFDRMPAEDMERWVDLCHDIVRRLRGSEKPVLAAIHGTAVGGGLEMTLHADLRFAAEDARFGQPEIAIGFIPPIAATQALARLMGRPRAIRYLYDGALLPAGEALAQGIVDELVPAAELQGHVQAYAEGLAAKPAPALAAIRRCMIAATSLPWEEGLAIERAEAVRLSQTEEFAAGVKAFLARGRG